MSGEQLTVGTSTYALEHLDWEQIAADLNDQGYALLPGLLTPIEAGWLAALADDCAAEQRDELLAAQLGRGELLYFRDNLPPLLADWRARLYRHLATIANGWNRALNLDYHYPASLDAFIARHRAAGQTQQQSHLSLLAPGDYQALHQRAAGEHVFPLQLVALLSAPGRDFSGGELVMTEQRPRMQSRPMVLPLRLGDAAIITTAQRPFQGGKGYYRVSLKHAISRVLSGRRIGLELLFHDSA